VELYQSLVVSWRLWRGELDPVRRSWIEQRILNDAGILGHYVTDGANPHHTSVHHNGWNQNFPNPRGFTSGPGFHSRFESQFVEANITLDQLLPRISESPRQLDSVRADGDCLPAAVPLAARTAVRTGPDGGVQSYNTGSRAPRVRRRATGGRSEHAARPVVVRVAGEPTAGTGVRQMRECE
jgi:hypothetical protein